MGTLKTLKFEGKTFFTEDFATFADLVSTNNTRENRGSPFGNASKKGSRDVNWTGASYEDAYEMLKYGDDVTFQKLQGKTTSHRGNFKKPCFESSVVGFAPIVPLVLMGVPNSMINVEYKTKKQKVLNIYYDIAVSAMFSKENVFNASVKLFETIVALEKEGFRINLFVVDTFCSNKVFNIMTVKAKDAKQPMHLKRLSYVCTNVSMSRIVGFDWYEKCPISRHIDAYGYPMSTRMNKEEINEVFKKLYGENSLYISSSFCLKEDTEKYITKMFE